MTFRSVAGFSITQLQETCVSLKEVDFRGKDNIRDLTIQDCNVDETSNLVISRRRYAENRKNTCSRINYALLTNDIIVLWCCYCRRCNRFLSSLLDYFRNTGHIFTSGFSGS